MTTYIIAEIGPNHNGSLETALEMVDLLSQTGTNAIKFQLGDPDEVYSLDAYKAGYQKINDGDGKPIEMSRRVQLSRNDHKKLEAACRDAGVDYLCTAFDLESLRFLDKTFDLPFFKIPSGEILSIDMLEYISGRDRPILLSTGMATFDEIKTAINLLNGNGSKDITLLHCVSNYPAPAEDIHLNVIKELIRRFDCPVGYSDHSIGPECCLGAVALGATVLEKHVTLDMTQTGPDHKASATVDELAALVASVRTLESALGGCDKIFSSSENSIRTVARKSIVARRDITAGEIIEENDVCFKRPGTGYSPFQMGEIVGHKATSNIEADRVIGPDDIGN